MSRIKKSKTKIVRVLSVTCVVNGHILYFPSFQAPNTGRWSRGRWTCRGRGRLGFRVKKEAKSKWKIFNPDPCPIQICFFVGSWIRFYFNSVRSGSFHKSIESPFLFLIKLITYYEVLFLWVKNTFITYRKVKTRSSTNSVNRVGKVFFLITFSLFVFNNIICFSL